MSLGQTDLQLTIENHCRDRLGLTYVYPVLSRRSNGLSAGINLNTNRSCNWRCIYCQVQGLTRKTPSEIDFIQLKQELYTFLKQVQSGSFYQQFLIPESQRQIKDIAISGNGEPTLVKDFEDVIVLLRETLEDFDLLGKIKLILITNGSQFNRKAIQTGVQTMAGMNGVIWFKLDTVTNEGMQHINQTRATQSSLLKRLAQVAKLCPCWIHSCFFMLDGKEPSSLEINSYINFLYKIIEHNIPIKGICLYGVARPTMQIESGRISHLPQAWFEHLKDKMADMPLPVEIFI